MADRERGQSGRDFAYIAVSDGKFYVNMKVTGFIPQYVSGPHDTAEEARESLAELVRTSA